MGTGWKQVNVVVGDEGNQCTGAILAARMSNKVRVMSSRGGVPGGIVDGNVQLINDQGVYPRR